MRRHSQPPQPVTSSSALLGLTFADLVLLVAISGSLILLPVLTLPSSIGDYDQKRLAELMLLALSGACYLSSPALRRRVVAQLGALPRAAWVACALVLLLGLVSSWRSASPRDAIAELCLMLSLTLLAVTLAAALRPILGRYRTLLAAGLLVMLALYLFQTAVRYMAWRVGGAPFDLVEMLTGLGHQRFVNQWQTLTLPLAVVPVLTLRRPWIRALAVLAAALWWALVIGSGARGTTLGVGMAVLLTPLLVPKARTWFGAQLLCASLGVVLAVSLFPPPQVADKPDGISRLTDTSVTASSNESRLVLWVEAVDLTLEHPVLGIGPMHFAAVGERGHPHNLILQFTSEWGLPATLLLIALALGAARAWLSMLPAARDPQVLHAALTASLIAAALHSMVSGLTVPAYTQLWLAFLAGLALCEFHEMLVPYDREGDGLRRRAPRPYPAAALGAMWVACLGVLGAHFARDVPHLGPSTLVAMERRAGAAPRFWRYGYIGEERGLAALLDPEHPLTPRPRYTLEAALERADLPFLNE